MQVSLNDEKFTQFKKSVYLIIACFLTRKADKALPQSYNKVRFQDDLPLSTFNPLKGKDIKVVPVN